MSQARPKLAIFADHNVPESAARAFEAAGHKVRRLRGVLPTDAPDGLVGATAAAAGEILVTHDKDFRQATKRAGISEQLQASLSRIQLRCREHESAVRLTAAMSLIEHEWNHVQAFGDGVLRVEINTSVIRTLR